MKTNKFLLLILAINGLFAQQSTTAKIESIKENGLHKIVLPAEIRSFSKEDLSDFRIFDAKKKEVPYFVIQENRAEILSSFSEFKVLSKNAIPRKSTTIIFKNPKTSIDEIVLQITNSDVTKSFSISGSNDQKEWFGLVNNSQLYNLESAQETSVFKTLNLPLSSYHYLKIIFDDKKTLPINILKVGNFDTKIQGEALQECIPKSIQTSQFLTQKKTRIHIIFDQIQIVNQMIFNITNPSLFKRNARIYWNKNLIVKHKTIKAQEDLFYFELNSETKNAINVPQLFKKDFFIEIDNQDNQPLTFSGIRFFQNQIAIIADLKANENYTIKTGNPKLNTPNYDLENFKSKIANNLPLATIYKIEHKSSNENSTKEKSIWQQAWFMWVCIALGGIAIFYFTASLVKDMKKNS
ncbi:MAG: hypothetical protein PHC28_03310 [Flavobacterium sp.]|uniref:hypothetical protein n=1 Tax=Flavobacterium sp. TaxID=239 RepID=UPI002622C240|nr:hypothetical protein [Flavobacterium sp.]MDD5149497.1 hypothetical protein [Flavobacterium sp.]